MAGQKTDERDAYVGQRIAEQRKRAALTQRTVAASFGMSAAQLQKYEKGKNRISALHLDQFSRMTGIPLAHFFEGMPGREEGVEGFAEAAQQPLVPPGPLHDAAAALAQFVNAQLPPAARRDVAAAAMVLTRGVKD